MLVCMFASMIFVSLCMEILMSVMPYCLRYSFNSSTEHGLGILLPLLRSLGLGKGMFLCLVFQLFPF